MRSGGAHGFLIFHAPIQVLVPFIRSPTHMLCHLAILHQIQSNKQTACSSSPFSIVEMPSFSHGINSLIHSPLYTGQTRVDGCTTNQRTATAIDAI